MKHITVRQPKIDKAILLEAYDFLIKDSALEQALTLAKRWFPDKVPETVEKIIDYSYGIKDYYTVLTMTDVYKNEFLNETAINVIDRMVDDNDYASAWSIVNSVEKNLNKVALGLLGDIKKLADRHLSRDRFFHYGTDKLRTPDYVKIDDLLEDIQLESQRNNQI